MLGGDSLKWNTLILLKVQEFARFLIGKSDKFDLKSPAPVLERSDSKELRERILSLSPSEARSGQEHGSLPEEARPRPQTIQNLRKGC